MSQKPVHNLAPNQDGYEEKSVMSLKKRATRRFVITLLILAVLLFIPGTVHFWQGWLFLGLMSVFFTFFLRNFLKNDPQLLERRLQNRETEPEQRLFQKWFVLTLFLGFILVGLDFRFGWSRALVPFPLALIIAGQVEAAAGYWLVFWVMKTNTFAASTIRVEANQAVIQTGPYAVVRHPMYTGMAITALAIPLALGSYVAIPFFAFLVVLLVYRLIHEERTLRRDLPGYAEYCQRTRFRLMPGIW
jgi:protein-S-isoprenylcysteine O-methyltransferase Ste14